MRIDRLQTHAAFSMTGLLAFVVAGHMGAAVAQPSSKPPSGDPCTVLPLSAVQKAFPGAKAGERNTRKEKYGVTECVWKDGSGVEVLVVQEFFGRDSAMDEIKSQGPSLVAGNAAQGGNIRYEILAGVGLGNEAVAFAEVRDDKRGIVSDGAMLAMHRGERTLLLGSTAPQKRDRAAVLKTFDDLGRIAAKRLD